MGSTLKGTISLLMNKTCILNFLNEFRELFDQGIYIYALYKLYALYIVYIIIMYYYYCTFI